MFQFLWKVLKTGLFLFLFFLIAVILLFSFNHLRAPKYKFPVAKPFNGEHFYNPYAGIDSLNWRKANYHMHSHVWGGMTNGSENVDSNLWKVYKGLGFESIGISNYQNINTLYQDSAFYIPVYEHGYGIFKNHQLCLGAKSVEWFDMPFKQSIDQKQYMINRLREQTELISINHPSFFKGYAPKDFSKLTGYDFVEVLNGFRNSIAHCDSALSAGRPAFLLANDDMHDISNPREPARRFLQINAPSNNRKDIFAALKAGAAFGVYIITPENETWEMKKERLDHLPMLKSVTVEKDTLKVSVNNEALEIRFLGQSGRLLYKICNSKVATYAIQPKDSYVRTQIIFSSPNDREGIQYFLNPVLRSADGSCPIMPEVHVDVYRTRVFRIIVIASALFLVANVFVLRKRARKRRRPTTIK